jgi:hypothetical protein
VDDRLPTELWISATLRRFGAASRPAYLVRRGDPERGSVLVRLDGHREGTRILTQARDLDGTLIWLEAAEGRALPADEAQAYVERAVQRDPDLWVIEIETPDGATPFAGRVE